MEVEDINVDNILLNEKSYENILVYNILYKKFMDAKPLRIRFDKADRIDVSDRIDVFDGNYVNKTSESKECDIFYY